MASKENLEDITEEELQVIAENAQPYSSDEEMFADIERLNSLSE